MRPTIEIPTKLLIEIAEHIESCAKDRHGPNLFDERLEPLLRLAKTPQIHIEGRVWYADMYGNPYHTTKVFVNNEPLWTSKPTYGGGNMFLKTGLDWLAAQGMIPPCPPDHSHQNTYYLREHLHGTYDETSVSRKKDLHV